MFKKDGKDCEIGKGQSGVVYLAKHKLDNKLYAIKVVEVSDDPDKKNK